MDAKAAQQRIEEIKKKVEGWNQEAEAQTDTFLTKLVNKPWTFWAVVGMALTLTAAGALAILG